MRLILGHSANFQPTHCGFILLWAVIVGLLCFMPLACDAPPEMEEALEAELGTEETAATGPRDDAISMTGIRLYLHDTAPTAGQARKPRFMVEADTSSMESDDSWSFSEARAVLYNPDTEEEDIVFQAGEGRFIENREAYLGGGVAAVAGNVTIQLDDIICENLESEDGMVAYTEHPVSIDSPALELDAATMQIHAAHRTMEFQDVRGWISFTNLNP